MHKNHQFDKDKICVAKIISLFDNINSIDNNSKENDNDNDDINSNNNVDDDGDNNNNNAQN